MAEPTSPSRSPPPPQRQSMLPTHVRSVSTSLPRPASRLPLSPTRSSSGSSSGGLFGAAENDPPPLSLHTTQSSYTLGNITKSINNRPPSAESISSSLRLNGHSNEMNASAMMPPPPRPMSSLPKTRSMSVNHTETSKRETLVDRAGRVPGVPGSSRITKPGSRANTIGPSSSIKQHLPRPKSSMERVRPLSSGSHSLSRSTSNMFYKGPNAITARPPSAQELRSSTDDDELSGTSQRPPGILTHPSVESQSANSIVASTLSHEDRTRLDQLEEALKQLREDKKSVVTGSDAYKEKYESERIRVIELETARASMESQYSFLKMELEQAKMSVLNLTRSLDDERRDRRMENDDAARKLEREVEEVKRRAREEIESLVRSNRDAMETAEKAHRDAIQAAERAHQDHLDRELRQLKQQLENEKAARLREVAEVTTQAAMEKQKLETKMDTKWREIRQMKEEIETLNRDVEREKTLNASLRDSLSEASAASLTVESTTRALKARMELLETDAKEKLAMMTELQEKTRIAQEEAQAAKDKLRIEETLRRKLHNQVQELKGNIRVFCRVRPPLGTEAINAAEYKFPDVEKDAREIEVTATERTAVGNVITKNHPFQFDRVFGPTSNNSDVFEEISQLVQSALDGYNVCIFCYGQTGSGKTYTMSSGDGMIPRTVEQIYNTAKELEDKGWKYQMEGSFVEVYNENINDLLGKADDLDKKKHEIRHDPKELKTTVTGLTSVILDSPERVHDILNTASTNRSVAATKANERSSRSHSVFMLRLTGYNSVTGERSEGTLNLVDLAGSERLSHSQVTGDRLKETQSINRSLACLGDVIGALGSGKEGAHIPYRNSKLTYLLQYSLGGNSKTLMFVMISPLQAHLSESLTSLKFATKVNNTSIGTAKKKITSS